MTTTMTREAWKAEACRRFGDDPMKWRFVCPVCGHEATVADWKAAGASQGEVGFSCVGRHLGAGSGFGGNAKPCDYAGGGLFRLNPVVVTTPDGKSVEMFAFAEPGPAGETGAPT